MKADFSVGWGFGRVAGAGVIKVIVDEVDIRVGDEIYELFEI